MNNYQAPQNQSKEYEEYFLINGNNAYKFLVRKLEDIVLIKCKNYEIKLTNTKLSMLTKAILNNTNDSFDFIINTFDNNKVFIKEIVNRKYMKLLFKVYSLNQERDLEIELLYNEISNAFSYDELMNEKYNNLKTENTNLKNEIKLLKYEINNLKERLKYISINQNNLINNLENSEINNEFNYEILFENYKKKLIQFAIGEVTTLITLKNKNDIAVCTTNGFIQVFNAKTLNQKFSSKLVNSCILDITELKGNKYCISCWDYNIRVIEFCNNNTECKTIHIVKGHKHYINSIRKLFFYQNDIIIASSSNDATIKLWKYDKNENFTLYQEIKYFEENEAIHSLEESLKYNLLIGSASEFENLYFFNLNNLSEKYKLKISGNRCIRSLKIIDNSEFLIVAGNRQINIVNINTKNIINSIRYNIECEFNCIFQKKNGNILITEYGEKCKIKELNLIKIQKI